MSRHPYNVRHVQNLCCDTAYISSVEEIATLSAKTTVLLLCEDTFTLGYPLYRVNKDVFMLSDCAKD